MKMLIDYRLRLVAVVLGLLQCTNAATIQIRVLNAKNGGQIKNEKVSVLIKGEKGAREYVTDAAGGFNLDVDPAAEIWVATEWWITCRTINVTAPHYISVEKTLKEGVTDENNCGHARSEPVKGKLVIFARKATLAENITR